jgi:hypothetical protein
MLAPLARAWQPVLVGLLFGLAVAAAVMATSGDASARATYESPYSYARTWNSALRMLRVDMGLNITEKDVDSGYLLFDYRSPESGKKVTAGSLEVLHGNDDDSVVRVVVQIPAMPQYHEQALIDSLAQKMKAEYGEPPPKKKKAPAPVLPEGGADAEPPPQAPTQPTP